MLFRVMERQAREQEKRITELERANRELRDQLQQVEWQLAVIGPKVDKLGAGSALTDDELQQAVRRALEQDRAEAEARRAADRERRAQEMREAFARRQEERLDDFAEALCDEFS